MPADCRRSTTGGKGNLGMYIERDPNIVAAGLPSSQQDMKVKDALEHYLLQEKVDALIGDAILPAPAKLQTLPPLRKPIPLDKRHSGVFGDVASLINPPSKSKFQCFVADFKETAYKSYWKAPVGSVPDSTPMLPAGFDKEGTTFGKVIPSQGRLYDIVMPKYPTPDNTPPSKIPGAQIDRKYCAPPYRSDLTFGHRTFIDKRGTKGRCCVTDDRIIIGKGDIAILHSIQSNFIDSKRPRLGSVLAPNSNVKEVPLGYTFGILKPPDNLPECLTFCEINKNVDIFRKCMKHLNTVRKVLSARFLPNFFDHLYLTFKNYDKEKSGWLIKDLIYNYCATKLIRFDITLIEPLLSMWQAFDGSRIEYKTFVRVINYRIPSPEIPKIPDLKPDCLEFSTTYREMVKPGQAVDKRRMAGLPSGRYFDMDYPITPERCCKADRTCLPHESDMKSCLAPSIFTQTFVSHRDMYEKRDPDKVRSVFEAAGEKFSDERFNYIWEETKKLHSKGWVCYETFRQTLEKFLNPVELDKK